MNNFHSVCAGDDSFRKDLLDYLIIHLFVTSLKQRPLFHLSFVAQSNMPSNFNWSHYTVFVILLPPQIFILIDLKSVSQLFIAIISCLFPATSAFAEFVLFFFSLLDFISSLRTETRFVWRLDTVCCHALLY